jgi:rare lipoprotein A
LHLDQIVGLSGMHCRAIAVLAAIIAAAPLQAQAGQSAARTFFGMAAYYSGRGAGLTAAHKTLPFGTHVRVTNLKTGRSVVVTINDRGPFNRGRVLDLCTRAARALGMMDQGVVRVRADVL